MNKKINNLLSSEVLEQEAIQFQESILHSTTPHKHPYVQDVKGIEYTFFPNVFNPNYAKAALLLLDNLGVQKGDRVMVPFTGSGVDAVLALKEGARYVVAMDKFTMPRLCAEYNIFKMGLDGFIDIRQGNDLDPLNKGEKFDLVIANPPFKNMPAKSPLEYALRDEFYLGLNSFWENIDEHLEDEGRIRMVFSDVGSSAYLAKISKKYGFQREIVASNVFASYMVNTVYEFTRK